MTVPVIRQTPSEVRYLEGFELRDMSAKGRVLDLVVANYGEFRDVGPFHERHMPTVFEETLSRHADSIKLVIGHDDSQPGVATPVEWRQGPDRLEVSYAFLSHEAARAALQMVEERAFGGCSVAFLPGKKPADNTWEKRGGVPYVTRHRARLLHVGMVTTPADADAGVLALRSMGVPEDVATPRLDDVRRRLEALRATRVQV
jgi:HK97 family phage prohead protease